MRDLLFDHDAACSIQSRRGSLIALTKALFNLQTHKTSFPASSSPYDHVLPTRKPFVPLPLGRRNKRAKDCLFAPYTPISPVCAARCRRNHNLNLHPFIIHHDPRLSDTRQGRGVLTHKARRRNSGVRRQEDDMGQNSGIQASPLVPQTCPVPRGRVKGKTVVPR